MAAGYPNIKAILILSSCFFTLFLGFNSAANSATKALRDSGFENLGYYSLSALYLTFGAGSFLAPRMIRLLSPKNALVVASTVYAIWIISLAITTIILESPSMNSLLGK